MMDFGDEGQAAETIFREAALAAASRPTSTGDQIIDDDGRVVCADCGEAIPAARLAAVPGVLRCRECQEVLEREGV